MAFLLSPSKYYVEYPTEMLFYIRSESDCSLETVTKQKVSYLEHEGTNHWRRLQCFEKLKTGDKMPNIITGGDKPVQA